MQSYIPAPILIQASRMAEAPLEQADSIVEAGTSGIPRPDIMIGPRCPCFTDSENALAIKPAWMSVVEIPASIIAFLEASSASSLAERGNLPYFVMPALRTYTFLMR